MSKHGLTRLQTVRPIVLGSYTLTSTGLRIAGRPTFEEHAGVGDFIRRAQFASGFWLADWLRYGESRPEWKERLEQMIDATGYSEKTLKNVRAVGAIEQSRRRDDVEFVLHETVAALEPEEQSEWLEQAAEHKWGRQELRVNIRAAKRRRIIDGQATLAGMYRVIYADPPWLYGAGGVITDSDAYGRSARHYESMSVEQLCKLPVAAHALPESVLFLWVTSPMLSICWPVIEAWGFGYKTSIVWDKVLHNFGHYVSVRHEMLLICTRGSCLPDHPTPMPDSVQTIRRGDVHSEKPEEFRHLIEQLYDGPYAELFARKRTHGWSCFGNQMDEAGAA